MPDLESAQIFGALNTGLVVIDRVLAVRAWNRWMAQNSGLAEADVVGKNLLDLYPNLAEPRYRRIIMSVFSFGSYAFFSQKLHRHLFPMKNSHPSVGILPFMQQNCQAGPIRNQWGDVVKIFIAVQDVTENVASEMLLKEKVRQQEAMLAKVRQLEGVISICMYCKKIRKDEKSWDQLERYISEHSEAQFSHGICPECFAIAPWEAK